MEKQHLEELLFTVFHETEGNLLENVPELGGGSLTIFDEPILGLGSATDPLFAGFKREGVIGPQFLAPREWLPGAETVLSIFYPFSRQVKNSNNGKEGHASVEWSIGRVEGQAFILHCAESFSKALAVNGIENCVPAADGRFAADTKNYSSNWSERHAAFVCGLGTFGLSRGLITRKGTAGRFSSLILKVKMTPDERPYSDIYEYCIRCGECARRCPGNAIPKNSPKDHSLCSPVVAESKILLAPRYGCGLCQTFVPCESEIPQK